MTRNCNRIRQKLRPGDPTYINFELNTEYLDSIIKEPFFRHDVRVKDNRHLVFTTDRQLEILRKAKTWYIDGTFKVVKDPFYQLLSIHAFIRAGDEMKHLPLVFIIMSRKTKIDYKKVKYSYDYHYDYEFVQCNSIIIDLFDLIELERRLINCKYVNLL